MQFSNEGENLVCFAWFQSFWVYCCHFVNFYKGGVGVKTCSRFFRTGNLLLGISVGLAQNLFFLCTFCQFYWSSGLQYIIRFLHFSFFVFLKPCDIFLALWSFCSSLTSFCYVYIVHVSFTSSEEFEEGARF